MRESKLVTAARIALKLAQAALPEYSHPKSPHRFTLPQLAACVLLKVHQHQGYRDIEELLLASQELRTVLGLSQVPDHTTLSRTYHKLRMLDFERMNDELLRQMAVEAEYISSDATGFVLSNASLYYHRRHQGEGQGWLKGVYAIDVRSLFIVAMCTAWGPSTDVRHLETLRRRAMPYGRRQGTIVDPKRLARRDLVDQARLDGLYGQHWKSETVNSVIKRKFGGAVFSHLPSLQPRDAIIKALVYNINL